MKVAREVFNADVTGNAPNQCPTNRVTIDGIDTFYREAGPADAPVVLLPHGYPCSSYVYRNSHGRARPTPGA